MFGLMSFSTTWILVGTPQKLPVGWVTHDFTHRLPVATLLTILCQWGRKTKEVIIDYC